MGERFDGRAAWAQLTPEEQAEIGRLALESTFLMLMAGEPPVLSDAFSRIQRASEDAEEDLDDAVAEVLFRLGVINDDMPSLVRGLA